MTDFMNDYLIPILILLFLLFFAEFLFIFNLEIFGFLK